MIKLTGLNNREFYVNCDLIEKMEATPDTILSLTTDKKLVVKETPEEIIEKIIIYKRIIFSKLPDVVKDNHNDL